MDPPAEVVEAGVGEGAEGAAEGGGAGGVAVEGGDGDDLGVEGVGFAGDETLQGDDDGGAGDDGAGAAPVLRGGEDGLEEAAAGENGAGHGGDDGGGVLVRDVGGEYGLCSLQRPFLDHPHGAIPRLLRRLEDQPHRPLPETHCTRSALSRSLYPPIHLSCLPVCV